MCAALHCSHVFANPHNSSWSKTVQASPTRRSSVSSNFLIHIHINNNETLPSLPHNAFKTLLLATCALSLAAYTTSHPLGASLVPSVATIATAAPISARHESRLHYKHRAINNADVSHHPHHHETPTATATKMLKGVTISETASAALKDHADDHDRRTAGGDAIIR